MNYSPEELISFFLLDPGSMTREQADAFSAWIRQDPDHARLLIRSSLLHRGIHEYFYSRDATSTNLLNEDLGVSPEDSQSLFENELWSQLSRQERDAPALELPREGASEQELAAPREAKTVSRVTPKGPLWVSFVSLAATFLLFMFYLFAPARHVPQDVATVMDVYEARWDEPGRLVQEGTRLTDNRKPLYLLEGAVKIQFDNGARVVIEAPAEFTVEAAERMRLAYGKLYARVPKPAIGFRVDTPHCGVIDLGTEFGIRVSDRGETQVHLMEGKAALATHSKGQAAQSQILHRDEAKRVGAAGEVQTISCQEREFVRDFDSRQGLLWNGAPLSLANVASGGNGFGAVIPNYGIDLQTGQLTDSIIEQRRQGESGYVPVPQLPFVDGVFVPDGGSGAVQLTSAGHAFDGLGDTSGQYFMAIGAYSHVYMYKTTVKEYTPLHLAGTPEGSSTNLCLHANAGITFDLQKIREAMPYVKLKAFTSAYGMPLTREDQRGETSDFYVFVDGTARMVQPGVSNQDAPGRVSVPLAPTDRFLTLVCTEGENNFGDWSLFVDPVLVLESADE